MTSDFLHQQPLQTLFIFLQQYVGDKLVQCHVLLCFYRDVSKHKGLQDGSKGEHSPLSCHLDSWHNYEPSSWCSRRGHCINECVISWFRCQLRDPSTSSVCHAWTSWEIIASTLAKSQIPAPTAATGRATANNSVHFLGQRAASAITDILEKVCD